MAEEKKASVKEEGRTAQAAEETDRESQPEKRQAAADDAVKTETKSAGPDSNDIETETIGTESQEGAGTDADAPPQPDGDGAGTDTPDGGEAAKKDGKGPWGFGFGKGKKEDKRDLQIAELNDKVKRQLAEFDNYRKRTEKEKTAMFEIGARSVLEKLLPVVDNFERGLAAIPEAEKESATAVGMDKIYKQLFKALEELEVRPIEAVGKEFSPDFHNAVMQAEVEGVEANVIVEEFQKGYLYRDSVLRYSMVKVNR